MPYFEHNGANIYYEKQGNWDTNKHPVILLHGNGESMEIFEKTTAPLLDTMPFLAIDTRGHGKSELVSKNFNFTYETFADDVYSLICELGINQFNIVGFSDGGITALILAMNEPSRVHVNSMIVIGANISPDGMKSVMINKIRYEKRIHDARHEYMESALCRLMLNEPHITTHDLGKIYASTVIVVGSHDIIKPSHTEMIADSIIHARLKVVEGCDHLVPQNFPERLREIIVDEFE